MRLSQIPQHKTGVAGLLTLAVCVLIQPLGFPAPPQDATPSNATAKTTQDIGWPRQISKDGATLVYYQPQVDEWKDYQELFCRVAFSLTPKGGKEVLGVASIQANTLVDKDTHTVYFRDIQVTSVRFPSLDAEAAAQMEQLLKQLVPAGGEPISVDRVMADLEKGKTPAKPVAVENNPPQIYYSIKPAITATTVECSQTSGYVGMFVIGMAAGAAIAYGTGYYYPSYVYWGGPVPYYRPWPATYGVGAVYHPYAGAYGVGRAAYGPYGAVGSSAWYNPATGRYGHAATA